MPITGAARLAGVMGWPIAHSLSPLLHGHWFERHGIDASVTREPTEIGIGEALLSRCADLGADLLVMGAYGHSRLTEFVLGGATRTVLQHMTVPVLTAH